MTEKALEPVTNMVDQARHSGNVALVETVHGDLDTVVAPDGELIVGVSQRFPGESRTLDLRGVVSDATDVVEQPGPDARRSYGEVYVVIGRPDGEGGKIMQETLIDYPNRRIITNPGAPDQREYPAAGLPQSFTTNKPYQFVPVGGDSSKPKTSNGTVLAAYMHAPREGSAVASFDPAAIARGDLAHLTHGYVNPAAPLTPQKQKTAPIADRDPIADAVAAAQRVVDQGRGQQALH